MIKNPKMSQKELVEHWYWYACDMYMGKNIDNNVYEVKLIDRENDLYLYLTEDDKIGSAFDFQLFATKREAEKWHVEQVEKQKQKIKSKLKTYRDCVLMAMEKVKIGFLATDEFIELCIMEKLEELETEEKDD